MRPCLRIVQRVGITQEQDVLILHSPVDGPVGAFEPATVEGHFGGSLVDSHASEGRILKDGCLFPLDDERRAGRYRGRRIDEVQRQLVAIEPRCLIIEHHGLHVITIEHASLDRHIERQAQRIPCAILIELAALQGDVEGAEGIVVCRLYEAVVIVIVPQVDVCDGLDVVIENFHIVCMLLIGSQAIAEHVYLTTFAIASERIVAVGGQRGGIDGDGGQTRAAAEGIIANVRHAGRNLDAGQTGAAIEGSFADGRHAGRYLDAGQTGAEIEGIVTDARHTARNDGIVAALNQRVGCRLDKGITVVAAVILRIFSCHRDRPQTCTTLEGT